MADFLDYFFQFPNRGSAQRDLIVGPLISTANEALLYQGNTVVPFPGYCVMVSKVGTLDPILAAHPDILLINDRTLQLQGVASVLRSGLATLVGLAIIISPFSTYAPFNSLTLIPPTFSATGFFGTDYWHARFFNGKFWDHNPA